MTPDGGMRAGPPAVPRWTDAFLDSCRLVADPEADAMSAGVFTSGGPAALGRLTKQLEDWEAPIPADLPADLRDFFSRPIDYPGWVDMGRIARAEDLFASYGIVTTSLILLNSFPRFLTNAAGARAFYMAGIFSPDSLRRRMLELAQFVLFMTERGGLGQRRLSEAETAAAGLPAPGVVKGRGVVSMQKLRIIHSNVRILLKLPRPLEQPTWDFSTFGEPINQEDLAHALMCFALDTSDALRRVGIDQSREDQEAMLMAWQTAGVLMGLRENLQPSSLEEAVSLRDAIVRRRTRATREGAAMANEVLQIARGLLPPGARRIPAALMRYQLGDEIAAQLGVPNPRILLALIRGTTPIWQRRHVFAALAKAVTPPVLRWAGSSDRLGGTRHVEISEQLARRLGSRH